MADLDIAALRKLLADCPTGAPFNASHFTEDGWRAAPAAYMAAALNAIPALLDAAAERDALRAQRDALVAAGERLIRATLMDTNSGAGIRKGWVEVRESQWDALFDERAPLVTLIRSAKEQP